MSRGFRHLRRQTPALLRVISPWLLLALAVLPALGFWLGLTVKGETQPQSAAKADSQQRPRSVVRTGGDDQRIVRYVNHRDLRFVDRSDGSVSVIDALTGREVHRVVGEAGFVRGVLRAMARERRRLAADSQIPFQLSRGRGGQLTLSDPATGESIPLNSFGSTNVAAFARFLETPGGAS